jgi:hypothetical protein
MPGEGRPPEEKAMDGNVLALWAAMGIMAKVVVLGLLAMLVALPVLAVKLARRGTGSRALGTIAASAPLLGVLGTVVGVMNACVFIAARETVPMGQIAAGVAEALLTTAVGLAIGLAALWLRAAFEGRAPARRAEASETDVATAGTPS